MYWKIQHSFIVVRECHVPKKHNWWPLQSFLEKVTIVFKIK